MAESNVKLIVDATQAVGPLKKTTVATKKLDNAVKGTNGRLRDASGRFKSTGKAAATATGNIQRFGVAFRTTLGPIVAAYAALNFLNKSLQVTSQRQVNVAKLTNGLKNLGGTENDLRLLVAAADNLGRSTLFDQEDFTQNFALLTSFQRIGVDSYERVSKAAADLATITGQDLKSAQIQLAKALEDPTKRVTDLARSGTVFTDQQKEQIKVLQESGQLLEAQNLILREIEKQYGGAAEAAGSAGLAGALDTLGEATRDFQEELTTNSSLVALAEAAIYGLADAIDSATFALKQWDKIIGKVNTALTEIGATAGVVGDAFGGLGDVFKYAADQFGRLLLRGDGMDDFLALGQDRFKKGEMASFGADYKKQELALAAAAAGFTPTPIRAPSSPIKPPATGKTEEERRLEAIQKQQKAAAERVRSLKQQTLLASALTSEERTQFEQQIQIADILENTKGLTGDQLRAELEATVALHDQQNTTAAINRANAQRKEDEDDLVKKLREQQNTITELDRMYESIGQSISTGIVDSLSAAVEGTKALADVAADTLRNIANILLQFGVNTALGGIPGLSAFFPGRAKGGTVAGGRSYMVGEKGPELFTPGRSGSIAPSGSFGGANVVVNVDASGSQAQGNQPNAKALGAAIGAAVQAELVKQKRPGGLLS
jgi:hypothetical protein